MPNKLTNKEFIIRSINVHGDKYDYNKVKYTGINNNVIITCPIHGEFKQEPNEHLRKHGCPKCGIDNKKLTTKEFIQKAEKIHNNFYDYSKSIYKNNRTKIVIICPTHGDFEQEPSNHLRGSGCLNCNIESNRFTNKEFIKRAKNIHGNRYDYHKVEYKTQNTKVTIICSVHGDFRQLADNHLTGSGCHKCADIKRIENTKWLSGIYELKYPQNFISNYNPLYRSSYELKAFEMIEEWISDGEEIKWDYESIKIPYVLDDKDRNYIPDLYIKIGNIRYLIEIKPLNQVENPDKMNQAKWKYTKKYCLKNDISFEIWTELELY